jgi:hypothetical protein
MGDDFKSRNVSNWGTDGMNNPDFEHHVQPPEDAAQPPVPFGAIAETPSSRNVVPHGQQRQRSVVAGTVFGAFVGVLMGAVVGAACCWAIGEFHFLEQGVLIGMLAGPFAGGLIGLAERKARGDLVRPDIATIVCLLFGFLPAILIGLQGMSFVRGKFSVLLLSEAIFVGPMLGLVIGGMLDRAFEEARKKAWSRALAFAIAGIASCAALTYLIDALAYGPDPKEVAREARAIIASQWNDNSHAQDAAIHNVTLFRKDRTRYEGFADVTFAGRKERLNLEVVCEGDMLVVSWTSAPREERDR